MYVEPPQCVSIKQPRDGHQIVINTEVCYSFHSLTIAPNSLSSAIFAGRAARIALVSPPWIVFASEQRFRPSILVGPPESPPCRRQQRLPLMAGAQHWRLVIGCLVDMAALSAG